MFAVFYGSLILKIERKLNNERWRIFSVTDHITGEETIYEKLFIIESQDDSGKNYIVYTDNTFEGGELKIYASIFEKHEDSTYRMIEIETEEEWSIIEQALEELQKDVE